MKSRIPALFIVGVATATNAATPDFNRDIRPILSNNCFHCHGPDEKERKGGTDGLRLDTAEGALADLGGYAAIVPGDPDKSEFIKRLVTHESDDLMPPAKTGKKLTEREIGLLRDWVKSGAKYAKHWAYESPVRPAIPEKSGPFAKGHWAASKNPIDAFLLARLTKENIEPQPEADRATLARRVALDLVGLPPSIEETDAFIKDAGADAYERFVDAQLAKPAFGEHWARMWLDLARYADSAGYADDPSRTIWAYRDYVIRAFNANKPFDQFTIEQLAGDLLPNPTEEQLVATAFHRNTMTNSEGGTQDEEFRSAAIVDRTNTTMAVWMGTSFACAQCHTHKYDPITQHEYYKMFAFLNNTEDADRRNEEPLLEFMSDAKKSQRAALEKEIAAVEEKLKAPTPALVAAAEKWAREFPANIQWQVARPETAKSDSGAVLTTGADGAILAAKNPAKTDTYTLEIPISKTQNLTALRLEALPHDSLPDHGPGFAAGNFVVTGVRAVVVPPTAMKGPVARYVRLELPGKGKILQISEVQVFSGAENVALRGAATQSSTYADAVAKRAIDGNTAAEYEKGSVAHSAEGDNPWWEVDLKTAQSLDRIVIWNRAELGERLDGFRIVALDEKRNPVWEKSGNKSGASVPFDLTGSRPVVFGDAAVDFTQADFDAEALVAEVRPDAKKKRSPKAAQPGWAIGGGAGKAHALTLASTTPQELPAGSKLSVKIEMKSAFAEHTLGHFRVSVSGDANAAKHISVPSEILAAMRDPKGASVVTDYYVREVAPESVQTRVKLASLRKEIEAIKPDTVPIMRELTDKKRRETFVHIRGNYLSHGDKVTEGVPAVFPALPADGPKNRLALAKWLVDAKNPLTGRVVANRFWESVFGMGIVRTSEEFGAQGELPTHPELLDFLATELVAKHWDTKAFLKLLVTSAAYRQSSRVTPAARERDPENALISRGPRVRLSAEMVRDQALAVSGLLSAKMYGPSVRPARPSSGLSAAFGGGLDWQTSSGEDRFRRGIYTEWRRTSPYPSMMTFDATSREVCTLRRNRSNTPLQALVTLNDGVYIEAAQSLARRITAAPAQTTGEKINYGYRLVLQRPATEKETARIGQLYSEALADFQQDKKKAAEMATNPIGPIPSGADVAELAAWTTVSNVLLNLDETLMKR